MELPIEFSATELASRREKLDRLCAESGTGAAVLYGANRSGSAVPWLTGWPVTAEAHALVLPGSEPTLFVSYVNHLPNARRLARGAAVVAGGRKTPARIAALLDRAGVRRLGVIGGLPWTQAAQLGDRELVDLTPGYTRLRLRKSAAEMEALRVAARLTDQAMAAMAQGGFAGATEHELQRRIQGSYVGLGGLHHVSYLGVTSPAAADRCVPGQWPTGRRVQPGWTVSCELSVAAAPDMAGQLLRTFVAAKTAPAVVRELHDVADACLAAVEAVLRPGTSAAELLAATRVVEDAGFTTVDDVVHGYGGGYLPPVLATVSREPPAPVPDLVLAEGMTLVVQPNVVLPDRSYGVQTGELLAVTATGAKRLHGYPRGLQLVP